MSRYIPGVVPDNISVDYVREELEKISQAMATQDSFLWLETLYAAPTKYREGMIVKADGTTWNPGSGAGVYCYHGGVWRFLG